MRYFEAAKVILAVWKVMIVLLEMQKIVFSFVKFIQGVYKRPNAFTDRLCYPQHLLHNYKLTLHRLPPTQTTTYTQPTGPSLVSSLQRPRI